MPLYRVKVSFETIVQAESVPQASVAFRDNQYEILADSNLDFRVTAVKSLDTLPEGWGNSLPFRSRDNKSPELTCQEIFLGKSPLP